ncbi:CII family transcriptional regulator [Pantoea piersonii]|uniref:CII family transcriptional regulator n=1 Tax=Pantoea piersonii TaxID=2364647 RepID=UPI00289BBE23|nr:CII family transcriptional regulator [Pantoea piersonii]
MDIAKHSKRIREVESEMRSRLVTMGQGNFAKMAGWADSKVSRLNIHDMAVTFVLLEKVWETSLIKEVARQAVEAVMPNKRKAPTAGTDEASQITVDF